jgi:SAM-dependent methyltransferase
VARQNIYDQQLFFDRYQDMRERDSGINATVEQPALRARLPILAGLHVIDLGCGDGQLCRDLAVGGAARVLGLDPSARMLRLAAARTKDQSVRYARAFAEDARLTAGCADLVVSSLAFHYIADLPGLLARIGSWLRPGGRLVFSMEHPIVTAAPQLGRRPCIVDGYFDESGRDTSWFVDGVRKYHRRVSTILSAVLAAGLVIEHVDEPAPAPELLGERPDLELHRRRPALLLVTARQPESGAS